MPRSPTHRSSRTRRQAGRGSRASRRALPWLLSLGLALAAAAEAQVPALTPSADAQVVFLDVRLNGEPVDSPRPLLRSGAAVLFPRADLEAWHLLPPAAAPSVVDGVEYFDLAGRAGVRIELDEATQTVRLELPPDAFQAATVQSRDRSKASVSASAPGAFLDYDLALQAGGAAPAYGSALLDGSFSGDWGLVETSVLLGRAQVSLGQVATRLETAYRYDDPERLTRLTLGDAIASGADWSDPFRFGGVQFGTRFGLQPGYIAYPTPTLQGGAALPSAVQVYVNDMLRYQGQTDAGPFTVPNVPVLTGAGDMRIDVTDSTGVQRSVTTPYYVSSHLLRSGLSDYSVEAGWTRLDYGQRSDDYSQPFASGTWRRGLDDAFTVSLHGDTTRHSQTAGGGVAWVLAPWGEFALDAAGSHGDLQGAGHLSRAAFTRQSDSWSFAASRQAASSGFTQAAWQDGVEHVSVQNQVFVGRTLGRLGSIGASFTQLRYSSGERIAVMSANWTVAVIGGASLSTYVARTRDDNPLLPGASSGNHASVGFMLTLPLGERRSASLSSQRIDGHDSLVAEADRTAPTDIDGGIGWRVLAAAGGNARSEADIDWAGRYADVALDVASVGHDAALRLLANGAIGTAGGLVFATRQTDDAYALVTVPDSPNLDVFRENQRMATTDDRGRAIVPGLRAYEANRISIDSEALPIDALVAKDALQVVPRSRGVALARFDVSRPQVASVVLRLPDGSLLPAGTEVQGVQRPAPLLAGYDGALYIDHPQAGERFEAQGPQGRCGFALGPAKDWTPPGSRVDCVCAPLRQESPR